MSAAIVGLDGIAIALGGAEGRAKDRLIGARSPAPSLPSSSSSSSNSRKYRLGLFKRFFSRNSIKSFSSSSLDLPLRLPPLPGRVGFSSKSGNTGGAKPLGASGFLTPRSAMTGFSGARISVGIGGRRLWGGSVGAVMPRSINTESLTSFGTLPCGLPPAGAAAGSDGLFSLGRSGRAGFGVS